MRRIDRRHRDEVAATSSTRRRTRVELLEADVDELRRDVRELVLLMRVAAVLLAGHVGGTLVELLADKLS